MKIDEGGYLLLRVLSDEFCDARASVRFCAEAVVARANGRNLLICMVSGENLFLYWSWTE